MEVQVKPFAETARLELSVRSIYSLTFRTKLNLLATFVVVRILSKTLLKNTPNL